VPILPADDVGDAVALSDCDDGLMRVYLGSDHAGFELKARLIEHLTQSGHDPVDCGASTFDAEDDYPSFCITAGARTVADPGSLGIVIGGSGNGEQIAANKVRGVRAALVWSDDTAQLAREHNDANIISIGARNHPEADVLRFIDLFLATPFSQGARHVRRIGMLAEYETTGGIAGHVTS
jgi:ribose 5-phosphate isomerase B